MVNGGEPHADHAPEMVEKSVRKRKRIGSPAEKRLSKIKGVVDARPFVDKTKPRVICSNYTHRSIL